MMPSASAVARVLACPTSHVLKQYDYRTDYADAGQDRHAVMEDAINRGDVSQLPDEVQAMFRPGDRFDTERAYAYDVATGEARELGPIKRRDYGLIKPFEIPGTIDLVVCDGQRIIVVDYKGFEEVDDAETNAQTTTYSLMVARVYGYKSVTVAIVYLIANRQPDIFTLEAFDLQLHANRLARLPAMVAAAQRSPNPVVGKHCKYCPALVSVDGVTCPAWRKMHDDVSKDLVAVSVEAMIPFNDDNDANDAYELRAKLRLLSQRLDAALYARANERPIPLRNGRMFGPHAKLGNEKLDGDIVYEVVRAKHGQAIADVAVERTASKTKLKAALGFVGRGKVAAAERDVLKVVREKGGSKRDNKTEIEEYAPQLQLVTAAGDG